MCRRGKKKVEMLPKHKYQSYSKCAGYCEDARDAAMMFLRGNNVVRGLTVIGVKRLYAGCKSCCKGKGFYKNCIEPLQKYIQQPHDHMFPDESDDIINNYRVYTPEDWARQYYNNIHRYWDNVYQNRIY